MGHEAWQMIGRTPGYIVAVRPLRKGAITDFDITQRMIRLLLQRAGVSRFNRPRVLICVPSAITEVERRAVEEAARGAGANGAYPDRAAHGRRHRGRPADPRAARQHGRRRRRRHHRDRGHLARRASWRWRPSGSAASTSTPPSRPTCGASTASPSGERTAEEIKLAIGSAWPTDDEIKAEVRGRDLMTGLPKTVILSPEEVREAIEEQVGAIVDSVVKCLGRLPAGAGPGPHHPGHPPGRRRRDAERPGPAPGSRRPSCRSHLVDAPLECVVLGAGKCLEEFDAVKDLFMNRERREVRPDGRSGPRPPGGPASPGRSAPGPGRPRPPVRSNGARASTARRRTAGLSEVASTMAASPPGHRWRRGRPPRPPGTADRGGRAPPRQRPDRHVGGRSDLAQGEAARLDHPGFPIGQRADEEIHRGRPEYDRELGGPGPHLHRVVVERRDEVVQPEPAEAGQGAECGCPHGGFRVVEPGPGPSLVLKMTGQGYRASAVDGGNLVSWTRHGVSPRPAARSGNRGIRPSRYRGRWRSRSGRSTISCP